MILFHENMRDIEYIDLPRIPDEFLESIEEIMALPKKPKTFARPGYPITTKYVSPKLNQYIESIFPIPVWVGYQVIHDNIPIHVDSGGNRRVCYNYLLQQGGDEVYTTFYNENHEVVQTEKLELHRWHRLNTENLHGVQGVKDFRIAITVTPQDMCDKWN